MALDPRITHAITEAVEEAGQPETLAHRLIAWFEAITTGNEDIHDSETSARHLDLLFSSTVIGDTDEEGDS
ncbi:MULTISPECIES: CxC ATPase DNA modification system associated small protein [Marinobacter]|uniref:CxC ATPase DNA modification system associated small protein n=1 Tax=Marinobacter TaxID=2742 RepID=UPI003B429843|nr:hypothetical protein PBN92_15040 [Marinobacter alkaliphilus]